MSPCHFEPRKEREAVHSPVLFDLLGFLATLNLLYHVGVTSVNIFTLPIRVQGRHIIAMCWDLELYWLSSDSINNEVVQLNGSQGTAIEIYIHVCNFHCNSPKDGTLMHLIVCCSEGWTSAWKDTRWTDCFPWAKDSVLPQLICIWPLCFPKS